MKRSIPLIILLVCVAGFVYGIAELFRLRFEIGDVYPAYSSLRTDPLGASALYESLAQMPGIKVSRDFNNNDELPAGTNVAYLHLSGTPDSWEEIPEKDFKEIQYFLNRGGRLVIAMEPQTTEFFDPFTNASPATNAPSGKSKNKKSSRTKPIKTKKMILGEDQFYKMVSIDERWGIGFGFKKLAESQESYAPVTVFNRDESSLPESVDWHSGGILTNLDKAWHVIYARGKDPVLVERRFGQGSVVFSTDSYFLSNEAMQKDRHADLLSWIVGPCHEVVFDEAHLGIVNQSGIATLMRNYHLHGFMAGLLLLVGLFIWKNSVSFVPRHEEIREQGVVAGKDSATGFVNLLRRHIRSADLLTLCVAEWKKSNSPGNFSAKLARVEALLQAENSLPQGQRNAIATYRSICLALKERSELLGTGSEFRVPSSELKTASSSAQNTEQSSDKKSNHKETA